jgi:hypothetical protein
MNHPSMMPGQNYPGMGQQNNYPGMGQNNYPVMNQNFPNQ